MYTDFQIPYYHQSNGWLLRVTNGNEGQSTMYLQTSNALIHLEIKTSEKCKQKRLPTCITTHVRFLIYQLICPLQPICPHSPDHLNDSNTFAM